VAACRQGAHSSSTGDPERTTDTGVTAQRSRWGNDGLEGTVLVSELQDTGRNHVDSRTSHVVHDRSPSTVGRISAPGPDHISYLAPAGVYDTGEYLLAGKVGLDDTDEDGPVRQAGYARQRD